MFEEKSEKEIREYLETKKKEGIRIGTMMIGHPGSGIRINASSDLQLLYIYPGKDFIGVAVTILDDGKISGTWLYQKYQETEEEFKFSNSKEFIKAMERKLIPQKSLIRQLKKRMEE